MSDFYDYEYDADFSSEDVDIDSDDILEVFEESFDPDGYTDEDYRRLMDRI